MEKDATPDIGRRLEQLHEIARDLHVEFGLFLDTVVRPWVGYQILIAAGVLLLAWLSSRWTRPRLHAWMRSRENWPKWLLRVLIVVHHRLRMILFVALIWTVVLIMRETTWPSRSYVLAIIADLTTAWLVVAFATRLIADVALRTLVRYGAWTWVTLRILGLEEPARNLLERAAFDIGEIRLSLWSVLQAALVIGVLFFAARLLTAATAARIRNATDLSPSFRVLAVKFLQVGLYGAAIFAGLSAVGVDLTGLAFLSGAIGVGLGFGLQKVVSNLVSGVIILLDKSIKTGDVISLGETFGWIQSLGARYVSVVTRDGKEYLIPNEDLITGQVVNWSHSDKFVRLDIHFGTSYADNPHDVRRIAIAATEDVPRVLSSRRPVCHIVGFGDSSVDYVLRLWISDPTGGLTNIRGDVYLALWDAFRAHGIRIPLPQREVRLLREPQASAGPDGPPDVRE